MSASEDVKTLFRRFGGEPEDYQEVVRERQAAHALGKWAMLEQVDLSHAQDVPGVRRKVKTAATRTSVVSTPAELTHVEVQETQPTVPAAEAKTGFLSNLSTPTRSQEELNLPETRFTPAPVLTSGQRQPEAAQRPMRSTVSAPSPQTQLETETRLSPLAARLKGQPVSPETVQPTSQTDNHSLTGLFGRLSKPLPSSPKPGVLRRKFIR